MQVLGSMSQMLLLLFFFLLILTCSINYFLGFHVGCQALSTCLWMLWTKRKFAATQILSQAFSVPSREQSQAHVSPEQNSFSWSLPTENPSRRAPGGLAGMGLCCGCRVGVTCQNHSDVV